MPTTQQQLQSLRDSLVAQQDSLNQLSTSVTQMIAIVDSVIASENTVPPAPPPAPSPVPPPAPPPPSVPPPAPPPAPPSGSGAPTLSLPAEIDVDANAISVVVAFTVSNPPPTSLQFSVLTRNGTAVEGRDFTRVSQMVSFQAGSSILKQYVTVPLLNPGAGKVGKTFELFVNGASINGVSATVGDKDQWGELRTTIKFVQSSGAQPPAPPPPAPVPPAPPPSTGTKGALVWQLDPNTFKASDQGGNGVFLTRFNFGRDQAGNGELGLYTDPLVYPGTKPYTMDTNGVLTLRAEKFKTPITYNGKNFNYGACVLEANWLSQLYGYYECEAMTSSARGTWGAFWLLPSDGSWPPEIDIYEQPRNGEVLNWCTTSNNHYNDSSGTHQMNLSGTLNLRNMGFPSNIDLTTDYHTYACDWRSDWTTFYVDGKQVYRCATTFKKPAYPLWDIAVGGWGGTPDFSTGTTEMKIRAARVYK